MTTDSPSDIRALQGALRRGFPFLGLMGSPAKIKLIRDALLQHGFSHQEIDKITAPVGLPIDSHTPAEIAISVTAQILQLRPTLFPALFSS
jgi:xanthine dehydrogenase accessory factor